MIVSQNIDHLTSHFYISKCQSKYLTSLKDNLPSTLDTCIVLQIFAENSMIIQDAVQVWHWDQTAMHHSSCAWFFNIAVSRNTFISSFLHSSLMIYIMTLLSFINCKNFCINFCMKGLTNSYHTTILFRQLCFSIQNYKMFLNLTFHHCHFGLDVF